MYDIIIIGAGPAGLAAAVYGQRAEKRTLLIDEKGYGGQIINTPEVENYPAIQKISGFDFANSLYQQAANLGAELTFEKPAHIIFNPASLALQNITSLPVAVNLPRKYIKKSL